MSDTDQKPAMPETDSRTDLDTYDIFRVRFEMAWTHDNSHDAATGKTVPHLVIADQQFIRSFVMAPSEDFHEVTTATDQAAFARGLKENCSSLLEVMEHSSWIVTHRLSGLIQYVATCEAWNTSSMHKEALVDNATVLLRTAHSVINDDYSQDFAAETMVACAASLIPLLPPGYAADRLQGVQEAGQIFFSTPLHAWPDGQHTVCGHCGTSRVDYWRRHEEVGEWFTPFLGLTARPAEYDQDEVARIRCPKCWELEKRIQKSLEGEKP